MASTGRNARVTINSREIQTYLDGQHGVDSMLRERAEAVLATAQANAPVDEGDYLASLHIEETHTDRLVVRVVSDAPHGLIVEANTGNMARALDGAR